MVVWNVQVGSKIAHVRFEAPITFAQFHPRNSNVCVVSSHLSDAVELNVETLTLTVIPISQNPSSTPFSTSSPSPMPPMSDATVTSNSSSDLASNPSDQMPALPTASTANAAPTSSASTGAVPVSTTSKLEDKIHVVDVQLVKECLFSPIAVYCPEGEELFVGDSRGIVSVVDVSSKRLKHHFKVASGTAGVKGLVVSNGKKWLLVNSSDRYIRIFSLPKCELHKELHDAVNRQQWKTMMFSPDSEHVLAGASHRHEHKLYFFSVFSGRMFKNLEGPKEGILDMIWHPTQPILVTVSTTGTMYVWGAHIDESWSAYTPGFHELEQNEEYIEREDEFDILDDAEIPRGNNGGNNSSNGMAEQGATAPPPRKKKKLTDTDENEDVDVVTIERAIEDDQANDSEEPELIGLHTNVIPDKYLVVPPSSTTFSSTS